MPFKDFPHRLDPRAEEWPGEGVGEVLGGSRRLAKQTYCMGVMEGMHQPGEQTLLALFIG
jgi:hypothetical protein